MANHGFTLERAREQVATRVRAGPEIPESEPVPFTPRASQVLARAHTEATARSRGRLGVEHVLLAVIEVDEGEGINADRKSVV